MHYQILEMLQFTLTVSLVPLHLEHILVSKIGLKINQSLFQLDRLSGINFLIDLELQTTLQKEVEDLMKFMLLSLTTKEQSLEMQGQSLRSTSIFPRQKMLSSL